ncbi:MAG: SRPBCC domain-containing protein [Mucilaginibacter polytrichastri]|nr:SRPBCC domain-containing protein [Mucilaginibacter polytrichastri]
MEDSITEKKDFNVSVDRLYKAWTEEAELKEWWHPGGYSLVELDADLQEGGNVKYVFESDAPNQGKLSIEGKYEAVDEGEKLVYTWNWHLDDAPVENGEYKLTVLFHGDDESSSLEVTQENQGESTAIHPHKEGWEKSLNALSEHLK